MVGKEQRGGDADGGDDLDGGADGLRVFRDLDLEHDERLGEAGKALHLVSLEAEGTDFARGGEVFAEGGGEGAELALELGGAAGDLAAEVPDRKHDERNHREADEHEADTVDPRRLVGEEADGRDERARLLDTIVGELREDELEL